MSKKKKAAKGAAKAAAAGTSAVGAVDAVRSSPYIQTAVQDGDLHDNVKVAYDAARSAYDRIASGKTSAGDLLDDKKLHGDIAAAAAALQSVGTAIRDAPNASPKKKAKRGFGSTLLLGIVGAGVALAVSSDLRNKVLDLLFGAEEEFDYTSTTTPATPAPGASA